MDFRQVIDLVEYVAGRCADPSVPRSHVRDLCHQAIQWIDAVRATLPPERRGTYDYLHERDCLRASWAIYAIQRVIAWQEAAQ